MRYRPLGRTGIDVSVLGFGSMRLPGFEVETEVYRHDLEEQAIGLAHHCFSTGVNLLDTAYIYAGGNNELLAGKILKRWQGHRIYLSTKSPVWMIEKEGDFRRFLEEQLTRLQRDSIDVYYLHGLDLEIWEDVRKRCDLEKEMRAAQCEGLFHHLAFSSHDRNLIPLMDTGLFEAVLLQYNLLDRSNEHFIQYAYEKGIGVSVMGPVAGGRLSYPSSVISGYMGEETASSSASTALRFVFANRQVSCALSGMSTGQMMDENAALASEDVTLNEQLLSSIDAMAEKTKALNNLYCTGCNYCRPCPVGINIPYVFQQMIYDKVYGLREVAENGLREIGKKEAMGANPHDCVGCGKCEDRCPQGIRIPHRLEEVCREYAHILLDT